MKRIILIFDIEPETFGGYWERVSSMFQADDIIYAVWSNEFDNEPYVLDTFFDDVLNDDERDLLSNFVDEFYELWQDSISKFKLAHTGYVVARCKVDEDAETLYIELIPK